MKDDSNVVTARKVVQLFQLPRILVLHLKRFSYTLNGTGKIHKTINYPERLRCAASELDAGRLQPHYAGVPWKRRHSCVLSCPDDHSSNLPSSKCNMHTEFNIDSKRSLKDPQYMTAVLHLKRA